MTITREATDVARDVLALRRQRDALLGSDMFGEPAWDMLLELFVAAGEERPITADELYAVAGVPPSTAQRWVLTLERKGKVERACDPVGGGKELVTLTCGERERLGELLRVGR